MSQEDRAETGYQLISPSEAARKGMFPREYVELPVDSTTWNGTKGAIIAAKVTRELGSGLPVCFYPRCTTREGSVFTLDRLNGERASAKDYLTYGWQKLRNAFFMSCGRRLST